MYNFITCIYIHTYICIHAAYKRCPHIYNCITASGFRCGTARVFCSSQVKLDLSFNLSRTQKGVCAFCLPWHYTLNPTLFFDCYIRRLQCIEGPVRLVLKTQCPYTTLTKLL